MIFQISILFASFLLSLGVCNFLSQNSRWLVNGQPQAVQDTHVGNVTRFGGVGIFLSFSVAGFFSLGFSIRENESVSLLVVALLFFSVGFFEDYTHKVSARLRLILQIFISFIIALKFTVITSIGIDVIDIYLAYRPVQITLTVFALTAFSNSVNLIDGMNGLAGITGVLCSLGIVWLGYLEGINDFQAAIFVAAILGFLVLNFPRGKIFLGDGGAYLIGGCVAFMCIEMNEKINTVSSWTYIVICAYPIFETVITVIRRVLSNKSFMGADSSHLHHLVFRILSRRNQVNGYEWWKNSALSSCFIIIYVILSITTALIFRNNREILILFCVLFFIIHIFLYFYLSSKWTKKGDIAT